MNKQNILTVTLVISGLALNPIVAEEKHYTTSQNKTVKKSVTAKIAKVLHKRGLDADAADETAINFVSDEDEILISMLIHNLEVNNILSKEEMLDFLSDAALHKQKFDFKSYDHVIGMVSRIKQQTLDKETLQHIRELVNINRELFV